MKIAVIGAGIGGLSTAALLASDGHNVTVFEKNETVGGKMNQVVAEGFRFDTGPSLLTMPEVLQKLFNVCGEQIDDYLELVPLDPLCRYFYPDGTIFDNFSDVDRSLDEIERIAPEDRQSYLDFLRYSKSLYEKTSSSFLFNPLFDLSDLSDVNFWDLTGIDALNTVSSRVNKYFSSPYLRRFFKRFATYNGSSPFKAPATLNVIPHVEINQGGYYVSGGIYMVAEALHELAVKAGANVMFNTEITGIITDDGAVRGLKRASGANESYDIIVSNSDAYETYLKLLPRNEVPPIKSELVSRTEPSCSGFVLLLGVKRQFEQLQHHNVFFSEDYEQEFSTIFNELKPAEDPTIYVANTSQKDPGHAVEGGSNLFVLVNAPYVSGKVNWKEEVNSYSTLIKSKLERRGLEGLTGSILYEQCITPRDFYQKYRSNRGSIYGTSSNSRLSAFLRPANKARAIKGLYLAGGSTHPGGGIPLVLLSAIHAYTLINRYET